MKLGYICITVAGAATLAGCGGGASSGGGTVQLTASGEVLALGGYGFPPATKDAPAFVDGWEVRFDKVLVTVDKITLSSNPDKAATDQSRTDGVVAEADGPWAIDLHRGGPLQGKGGSAEQALPVVQLANQNRNGGKPFDETQRYAFGFDLVAAATAATRLNIAADDPDYAEMAQKGWAVLYVGTATWKGDTASCTVFNGASYDFSKLPTTVKFRLGFASPTTYVNCQNPDLDPAKGIGGEDHQRGVQVKSNTTTVAQVTVHTDHPFWESIEHDSPAHFDPLAALAKPDGKGNFVVTLDDTAGVSYRALTDANHQPLPWRACRTDVTGYQPANDHPQMGYDSKSIDYNPSGDPAQVLRDLRDYMTYNQSTQGHLNSDGLCFVKRNYPSPQ